MLANSKWGSICKTTISLGTAGTFGTEIKAVVKEAEPAGLESEASFWETRLQSSPQKAYVKRRVLEDAVKEMDKKISLY